MCFEPPHSNKGSILPCSRATNSGIDQVSFFLSRRMSYINSNILTVGDDKEGQTSFKHHFQKRLSCRRAHSAKMLACFPFRIELHYTVAYLEIWKLRGPMGNISAGVHIQKCSKFSIFRPPVYSSNGRSYKMLVMLFFFATRSPSSLDRSPWNFATWSESACIW